MKQLARAFSVFVMVAALLGATSGNFAAAQDIAGAPKLQAATGRVASVDLIRRMLTVESKGLFSSAQMKTFVLSGETDISDRTGRQQLRLNELQPGAKVKIEYAVEGNKSVAHSITLQEAAQGTQPHAQASDPTSEQAPRAEPSAVEERSQAPASPQ